MVDSSLDIEKIREVCNQAKQSNLARYRTADHRPGVIIAADDLLDLLDRLDHLFGPCKYDPPGCGEEYCHDTCFEKERADKADSVLQLAQRALLAAAHDLRLINATLVSAMGVHPYTLTPRDIDAALDAIQKVLPKKVNNATAR